jgi:DNA-3-methyladenine glycosylase II
MTPKTHAHLSKQCPVLKRLIEQAGPCDIVPQTRSPFEALVRAVAHQQLNGTAAETILGRFLALFPHGQFPAPDEIASVPDEAIRAAGFSRSKLAAIRDISEKAMSGVVPHREELATLPDDEIVERLTQCRGVGRWTVEMFLMFTLGRPDVLPVDDFGVRNGYRIAYGLSEMPTPKELQAAGEKWRPYRTTASWYMWRAVDLARESGSGAAKVPSKAADSSKKKTKPKSKAKVKAKVAQPAKPKPKSKAKVKAKTKAKPVARKSQPLKKRAGGGRA